MNPQQQSRPAMPAAAPTVTTRPAGTGAKSDFEKLLEEKVMIYSPFGAPEKDTIKLTPKIVMDLICVPTKSGKVCTEADAIKFMMMCKARRLNPFEGDAYLIGYDTQSGPKFSLITAHQAFLKRAEVHAEFDGMTSGVILLDGANIVEREGDFHLPDERVVGGWATVHFKNRSHPTTRKIRLERFNTGMAQWGKDPAGMIVKCAEADSLRSSFPTLVGGLYLDGEIEMDFGDVAKLNTSKPLFESATPRKKKVEEKTPEPPKPVPVEQAQPEPEPAAAPDNEPRFDREEETPQQQEEPPRSAFNPVKALNSLLRMGGFTVDELLGYWVNTGAMPSKEDGGPSSIEEANLVAPTVVEHTARDFTPVADKIKGMRGGK